MLVFLTLFHRKCMVFCPPPNFENILHTSRIPHMINAEMRVTQKKMLRSLEKKKKFFFLSRFFFTDTDDSQDSRGREGTIFYSTLPLPSAHEH